ncbi:31911_t:CDS:2, partial [Racocetra persica]
ASAIKPFGLVQKHLFKVNRIVQDKLLDTLESMPFISHLIHDKNALKDELSTEQLEKRLDLLQLFLRDYVVNVQYLEKIQQSNTVINEVSNDDQNLSNNQLDIQNQDCNSYITNPSEKDGSYYNGYFSIPFENSYKLILSSSNNTKYGKRGKLLISFQIQFMDKNASRFFVRVSDSENVYLKQNISSTFLQSITQSNTYEVISGDHQENYYPKLEGYNGISTGLRYETLPNIKKSEVIIGEVLDSLGLLGGAWSLAAVAYKLLF